MIPTSYSSDYIDAYIKLGDTGQTWLGQTIQTTRDVGIARIVLPIILVGTVAGYCYTEILLGSTEVAIENGASAPLLSTSLSSATTFLYNRDAMPAIDKSTEYIIALKSSGYTYGLATSEITWGSDQSAPMYLDGVGKAYTPSTWSSIATATDFSFIMYTSYRTIYDDLASVETMIRQLTNQGKFDTDTSHVTIAQATLMEDDIAYEIDGWITAAGFSAPVTSTQLLNIIKPYANFGMALNLSMTERTSGFRGERGADTGIGALRSRYYELRDGLVSDDSWIRDAFILIGETVDDDTFVGAGLTAGGISDSQLEVLTDDTDAIQPTFSRGMMDT